MPKTETTLKFKVIIEFGISGYRYSVEEFDADNFDDLAKIIDLRICQIGDILDSANEEDGDLRKFTPSFANGYPSLSWQAEFGDDYTGCILETYMDGVELPYHNTLRSTLKSKFVMS